MTIQDFNKVCEEQLKTTSNCEVVSIDHYLGLGGLVHECEFIYKGKEYRLNVDRYGRIRIYNHEPYPTEMKHYERVLKGKLVYEEIIRKEGFTIEKFFQEN